MSVHAQDLQPGSVVGRHIFGLAHDVNGDPLLIDEKPLIFAASNFAQTVSYDDRPFTITGLGETPGGLFITRYDGRAQRYIDTASLDATAVDGLDSPSGGVVTPWHSVLFSETGFVDGARPQQFVEKFKPYFKGKADLVKPYNYGWTAEAVLLDREGRAKIIKDYALGRVSASQIFMMPDGKTVYLFDGDDSGILYLFVSDKVNSLTSGALYGVSFENNKVVYDTLGKTSSLKVRFRLDRIKFDDLFDRVTVKDAACPQEFTHVNTVYGDECLRVKPRNRKYIGLFEPVRTLAIQRQGQPLTKFTNVEIDESGRHIRLTRGDGTYSSFNFEQGASLGSEYVIQGAQQ
jgi:hypothetical protein